MQRVLSRTPRGHALNYRLQLRTGTYPRSDERLSTAIAEARAHIDAWHRLRPDRDLDRARFFEFGAGWDLAGPLALHCMGVNEQVVIDLRPLVRAELVDHVVEALRSGADAGALVRVPGPRGDRAFLAYLRDLGIDYRAPCDASDPGLAAGSVACITSTNTMEHIPAAAIPAILDRCAWLLDGEGLASFAIDYEDHYAKFDSSISVYNFLRYDERAWGRFNSGLHFQNRLRHHQHRELIEAAGFTIVEEELLGPSEDDLAALRDLEPAEPWAGMAEAALAIRGCRFSLVRSASA